MCNIDAKSELCMKRVFLCSARPTLGVWAWLSQTTVRVYAIYSLFLSLTHSFPPSFPPSFLYLGVCVSRT